MPFRSAGELMARVVAGDLQKLRERLFGIKPDVEELQIMARFWPDVFDTEQREGLLDQQHPLSSTFALNTLVRASFGFGNTKYGLETKIDNILTEEEKRVFLTLSQLLNSLNPRPAQTAAQLESIKSLIASPQRSKAGPAEEIREDVLRNPADARQFLLDNNSTAGGLTPELLARLILFSGDVDIERFIQTALGLESEDPKIAGITKELLPALREWFKTNSPYSAEADSNYPAGRVLGVLRDFFPDKFTEEATLAFRVDMDLTRASQILLLHLTDNKDITEEQFLPFLSSGPYFGQEFVSLGTIQTPAQLIAEAAEQAAFSHPTLSLRSGGPSPATTFGVSLSPNETASLFPSLASESEGARTVLQRYTDGDLSLFTQESHLSPGLRRYAGILLKSGSFSEDTASLERDDATVADFLQKGSWSDNPTVKQTEIIDKIQALERKAQRVKCVQFARLASRYRNYSKSAP